MKRSLWLLIGACTCFSASAYGSPWDKLDAALSELARRSGTTVDRLRVDPAASALENDRVGTLRLERYLMAEPQRAPGTVEAMSRNLAELRGVAPRLEMLTKLSWDRPPTPHPLNIESVKLPGDSTSSPVEDAMKRLYAGTGKRFQGKERSKVIEDSRRFPRELQVQVASLIDAVSQASRMRESVVKSSELKQGGAFEGKSHKTANLLHDFLNRWWEEKLSVDPKMSRLIYPLETFDLDALYAGAIPLARTLDKAGDALTALNVHGSFHADWQTPLGRIAVGGDGNDSYDGAYALIVDVGGNDVYHGPGAASGQDPVALVLDLGGDDRYAAADSAMAGPGGAVLGYAGILDEGSGKDTYEGTSWAAGFGFLGVGWINDRGGDDTYRMQLLSQGSALFGIGLLLDEHGDDQFRLEPLDTGFRSGQSQGFGGPLGIGMLIDLAGNDTFVDTDTLAGDDWATQNLVQGSAWGGSSRKWAGGLGWVLDARGTDTYTAMTSAQGVGFDSGLGVLADISGNDEYRCAICCQGFGAYLGTGILYDESGADRYHAQNDAMATGLGLGLGMLIEGSGDDVYDIESKKPVKWFPSVASSVQQGVGWLLDMEGSDRYPDKRCYVKADSSMPWRAPVPGVCVLIDIGQPDSQETFTAPGGEGPALGGMLILPGQGGPSNPSTTAP